MKSLRVAASMVGVALCLAGCGGGSSSSNGCVQQSSEGSPGSGALYTACAAACSCSDTQTQITTCAAPCLPYAEPGDQVTGPIATCLSFDKKTFYCSRICTSDADCLPAATAGSCDYGPVHEVGGVVIDTTKYCIKK